MPRRPLGRTGESVSMLGMGGSHLVKHGLEEPDTIRLIRTALDAGLNFLDNSWDYHHGESERRMGKALAGGYRDKAFLMTKVDGRTSDEAARQIDESLKRLKVDHVDLLQHHEIIRFDDVDRIFAQGGAMEAFTEAQQAGKIRFIGFTGHKDPAIHLYMLEVARRYEFRFDTVQMPLNPFDGSFRSFERKVLPQLAAEEIGILGMKSMGGGVLLKSKAVSAVECLRYALSLPTSVVITGIDSQEILDQALETAARFTPLNDTELAQLRSKAAPFAATGEWELFKTTTVFDATIRNPDWLGKPSERSLRLTKD